MELNKKIENKSDDEKNNETHVNVVENGFKITHCVIIGGNKKLISEDVGNICEGNMVHNKNSEDIKTIEHNKTNEDNKMNEDSKSYGNNNINVDIKTNKDVRIDEDNNEYKSVADYKDDGSIVDNNDNKLMVGNNNDKLVIDNTTGISYYEEIVNNVELKNENFNQKIDKRILETVENSESESEKKTKKRRGRKPKNNQKYEIGTQLENLLNRRDKILNMLHRDQYHVTHPEIQPFKNMTQFISSLLPYHIYSTPTYEDLLFHYSNEYQNLDFELLNTLKDAENFIKSDLCDNNQFNSVNTDFILDILEYRENKFIYNRYMDLVSSPKYKLRLKCKVKLRIKRNTVVHIRFCRT